MKISIETTSPDDVIIVNGETIQGAKGGFEPPAPEPEVEPFDGPLSNWFYRGFVLGDHSATTPDLAQNEPNRFYFTVPDIAPDSTWKMRLYDGGQSAVAYAVLVDEDNNIYGEGSLSTGAAQGEGFVARLRQNASGKRLCLEVTVTNGVRRFQGKMVILEKMDG